MNIVSKVINRLELEKCKIEQYRVGKKNNYYKNALYIPFLLVKRWYQSYPFFWT